MKKLSIAIWFICAALLCGRASAGETDYDAGARALPLQQAGGTARATAMGSAVVAVPQGSASLLWNPAGLSRMDCTELGVHHNSGLANTIQEIAIFGIPLGPVKPLDPVKNECHGGALGGLAASLGYVDYGSFSGRDDIGLQTGNYHNREYSGSLGWGIELLPGFSGGFALKTDKAEFPHKSYSTYAADVGVLWKALPALDLGAAYSNIKLGSNIGKLVSGLRLGAAWTLDKHLLLAASGELQESAMNRLQVGTEYLIGNLEEKINILALRAGYQANYPNPQLSGLTGLTLGLGYTITRSMTLDYAMVPAGELGTSHRFSLTFKFDCPEKAKPQAAAAPQPEPAPKAAYVEPQPIVLKSILLEDSHFDFDKSILRPEGMQALWENIQILKDNPKALVRIEGYTSMSGTAEYNQLLSERRAKAVEDFLVTEGEIKPGRITAVGYGAAWPETYEPTPGKINSAAAKSNMRVLFTVTVK